MIFDVERGFVVRITESRLRRVISNVISEMSDEYTSDQETMPRASACMSMGASALVAMCAEICIAYSLMAQHCVNLCEAVLCYKSLVGCSLSLEMICKCEKCCKICKRCCKC